MTLDFGVCLSVSISKENKRRTLKNHTVSRLKRKSLALGVAGELADKEGPLSGLVGVAGGLADKEGPLSGGSDSSGSGESSLRYS